jgi:hypothetical protein
MLSFCRPKECEASRYRHGCDPPKQSWLLLPPIPTIKAPRLHFKAIPHSTDRVAAIPAELSVSLSYKTKEARTEMQTATLTTTLSELNRLYGVYYEVTEEKTTNLQEAQKAWIEYETYATRYKKSAECRSH